MGLADLNLLGARPQKHVSCQIVALADLACIGGTNTSRERVVVAIDGIVGALAFLVEESATLFAVVSAGSFQDMPVASVRNHDRFSVEASIVTKQSVICRQSERPDIPISFYTVHVSTYLANRRGIL